MSQNKTHFAYRFLVVCKLLSEVAKQEEHRRRQKTDLRIVQSERISRTNKSDRPIRSLGRTLNQQVGSSNQIAPAGPTSCTGQSYPSYGPTFSIVQSDLSYGSTFRIVQSDLSYGPTFCIVHSDISYRPTLRIVQSDLSYGRTSHTS